MHECMNANNTVVIIFLFMLDTSQINMVLFSPVWRFPLIRQFKGIPAEIHPEKFKPQTVTV